MNLTFALRLAFLFVGAAALAASAWAWARGTQRALRGILLGASLAWVLVAGALCANHVTFPLHLDLMEGTVLQHYQRAMAGQPIYPEPAPEYVPLAYNPLYYVFAVPLGWVLGAGLSTLRVVSIIGWLVSGMVLYRIVRQEAGSRWWAWLAVGLFVAAYRAMDSYLDSAHSDSWMLATALLGTYLISRGRSRLATLAGVAVLVASFWFKQHGALFALGGVVWLTARDGWRRTWPAWALSALEGPLSYLLLGPPLFGPWFHYFTWQVPSQWSELNLLTARRLAGFTVRTWPALASAAGVDLVLSGVRGRGKLSIWQVQGIAAALTGVLGALDPGSSNNVFIPMGTWFILLGVLALRRWEQAAHVGWRRGVPLFALAISFAVLAYNPAELWVPPAARRSYADLLATLRGLPGTVYAPSLGQLGNDYTLVPAAHWVALEDLIRGPGQDTRDNPVTRELLEPAIQPDGQAWILANLPLDTYPWMEFLDKYYVLEADYADRFRTLGTLPKRFTHGWPRYLYRYEFP